jgi:hypothetical protein
MWEAGGDSKAIAQREREHNPFLVLYDEKQVQAAEVSQRRTAVSSKCFQLYEISSSHGGEYDVQSCLLGCTAV